MPQPTSPGKDHNARRAGTPGASGGTGGLVFGVSVGTILQMLQLERRTCRVRVLTPADEGVLHLVEGDLVHATTAGAEGEGAVYEILAWSLPEVEIDEAQAPARRTVRRPLSHLILDAARRADERGDLAARVPWIPEPSRPPVPTATPEGATVAAWSPASLGALEAALHELTALEGSGAATVIDIVTGIALVSVGDSPGIDPVALGAGVAAACREALRALRQLAADAQVGEIRFALAGADGLARPLRSDPELAWVLLLDRDRSDLAAARRLLDEFDARFSR